MKKEIMYVIFVFISIFIIGCGNKFSKYSGTYSLKYTRFVGDPQDEINKEKGGNINLDTNGMGKIFRDGKTYSIEWNVENNEITINEKYGSLTNIYNGTIENGVITLYNGEKSNPLTMIFVYAKQ